MDKEQLEALYGRYKESARRSPKLNMRAFWNDYVAHALAFAIGVEDSPPSEEAYKRISDYYADYRLVASQQLVDAFIAHAASVIAEYSEAEEDEATGLTLEDVGVAPEVANKLSRHGITSIQDIYTNELDLTDRQFGMLVEGLAKGLKRASPDESEGGEDDPEGEGDDAQAADSEPTEGESEPSDDTDAAPSEEVVKE